MALPENTNIHAYTTAATWNCRIGLLDVCQKQYSDDTKECIAETGNRNHLKTSYTACAGNPGLFYQ